MEITSFHIQILQCMFSLLWSHGYRSMPWVGRFPDRKLENNVWKWAGCCGLVRLEKGSVVCPECNACHGYYQKYTISFFPAIARQTALLGAQWATRQQKNIKVPQQAGIQTSDLRQLNPPVRRRPSVNTAINCGNVSQGKTTRHPWTELIGLSRVMPLVCRPAACLVRGAMPACLGPFIPHINSFAPVRHHCAITALEGIG